MKHHLTSSILILSLILALSSHTMAHKVGVYAVKKGNVIEGEGGFGKGRPCKDCDILVLDSQGKEIDRSKTDETGLFKITLPPDKAKVASKVVMEGGPGHRAEWVLEGAGEVGVEPVEPKEAIKTKAEEIHNTPNQLGNMETLRMLIREEVQKCLLPIQKELLRDRSERPGFKEIFGGIGYIVGIAGIWLYFKARKRTN